MLPIVGTSVMLLKLNVGLDDNSESVGTDVFDKRVGAIVLL